jgi:triosephosphate isomerase
MSPSTLKEAKQIFNDIKKTAIKLKKVETIICPPVVYLSNLTTQDSRLKIGSQNIFWLEKGAYTGEISAEMLKDFGVKYVIIGHSERREYLGETNKIINKKIKIALKNNLKVIFCVGEKERDKDGNYPRFIKEEILEGLKNISRKFLKNLIIVYEPVWAIGKKSKDADKPGDVLQMSIYIKRILLFVAGRELSRNIPILYGGSVEPENCGSFLKKAGVQGLLVGHESLVPKRFNEILKIAEQFCSYL